MLGRVEHWRRRILRQDRSAPPAPPAPAPAEEDLTWAYQQALGRDPDPAGTAAYLPQLRDGRSRAELALELRASREGTLRLARCHGFEVDERDDGRFIEDLYRAVLGREVDEAGRRWLLLLRESGASREAVALTLSHCEESLNRQWALRTHIQDLHELRADAYRRAHTDDGALVDVFRAETPKDVDWMEDAILTHGYYEKPGIWSLSVDDDKRRMGAVLAALSPTRALELGCSSGAVMAELARRGVECWGLEISRMAIQRALPEVRSRILHGDLLGARLDGRFDLVYGLDVFEHLNPNRLPRYLDRVRALLTDEGFVYVNSPAFGNDPVYGEVFPLTLAGWRDDAERGRLFRDWLVDAEGYPAHGHLIWASSTWWTEVFAAAGLYRQPDVERALHRIYDADFDAESVARKAFFVFAPTPDPERARAVVAALGDAPPQR